MTVTDIITRRDPAAGHLRTVRIDEHDTTAKSWWDYLGEPDAVLAVLDMAWLRGDAGQRAHERILALVAPSHVESIDELTHDLYRIQALKDGELDAEVGGDDVAENEAEALKHDVVYRAALVASLIVAGAR